MNQDDVGATEPGRSAANERLREVVLDLERAKETEKALREETAALLEGLRAIAETRSADELFSRLLAAMQGPLASDVALVLTDPDGRGKALSVIASTDASFLGRELALGTTLARALAGRVTTLLDTSAVVELRAAPFDGIGSLVLLPLAGDTSRALILFGSRAKRAFGPRHGHLVKRLAPLANQALREVERSETIARQHRDMRQVLEHVDQGLMMIDLHGHITGERSAQIDRWFGARDRDRTIEALLSRVDPRVGEWMTLALDELREDILPREMLLAQLPARLVAGPRTLHFDYQPLPDIETLTGVFVVITDITAALARERADLAQREFVALATRLLRDPTGLESFFEESEALIAALGRPDRPRVETLRALHTLKGNASIMGLASMAATCHEVEDAIEDGGRFDDDSLLAPVKRAWAGVTKELAALRPTPGVRSYAVPAGELDRFIADAEGSCATRSFAERASLWRLDPISTSLERLADDARALANHLDKAHVTVTVDADDIRIDGAQWRTFFGAYVHCIRNALDHGVESERERIATGKPAEARLTLIARREAGQWAIEARDDGRGIDWDRVAVKARALGMPTDGHADLLEALFADGLSTCDATTEISGRGLGLGAVREACRALGGALEVISERGRGTTFRCVFPAGDGPSPARARRLDLAPGHELAPRVSP